MAYDFNSLTKQAAEASNRDKFYTDFGDVDPNKLHQISELTNWMRTKAKGSDVREVIAQLFERTWIEGTKEGNANFEVAKARGYANTLGERLDQMELVDKSTAQDVSVVSGQINNLIANAGNGTVPSEVIDARIADDGTVFPSVGAAMRNQFNLIKKSLVKSINIFNFANAKDGYYCNYSSGRINAAESHTMSEYIQVRPSTQYLVYSNEKSNLQLHVAFFDSSKTYISGTQYGSFITPANTAYAVISFLVGYKTSVVFSEGTFSRSKTYIPYHTVKQSSNSSYTLLAFNDRQQTVAGTTVSNQYDTSFDMSFDGQGRVLFTKNVSGLGTGDFFFGRATIVTDVDVAQLNIQVIGADGVYYNNIYGNIKAGKTYNLYFNTAKFTSNSNPKQHFQINAKGSGATTIKFSNVCFSDNGYDCYYDDTTLKSLPIFDTTEYTIGLDGQNHFFDIAQACEFVKRAHDVDNVPVTLYLRNGEYEVFVSDKLPYAIYKGANKISIIGESRSGVIITKKCTATNQGKIIEAGGECTLANFTIKQINDGTYNQSNDYGSNPYCIHLDSDPKNHVKQYVTEVSNVTAYNNVNAPIGCGLRDHQTLVFDNVETIYEAPTGINGAFYVHGPNQPTARNCELKVNASTFNHDSVAGYCINTGNVEGCLPFTEIPVTFTRNSFGTKSKMVRDNFKADHKLTEISSLNNVVELNY